MNDSLRHLVAARVAAVFVGCMLLAACAFDGFVIAYPPPPEDDAAAAALAWRVVVEDARVFHTGGGAAPRPSTQGDATDAAWTGRVFGRRRTGQYTLASDRFTAEGQTVASLVGEAIATGLVRGEAPMPTAGEPVLRATVDEFWVHVPPRSYQARLGYRAFVRVAGPAPGFESGAVLEVQGSVGAAAEDGVLWKRAVVRALEALEAASADVVRAAVAGEGQGAGAAP